MHRLLSSLILSVSVCAGVSTAFAALPALDSAANPAYDTGWADGSNGGFGFGPWQITTNSDSTHFAGTFSFFGQHGEGHEHQESIRTNRLVQRWLERWGQQPPPQNRRGEDNHE